MTNPQPITARELRLRNALALQGEITEVMSVKQTARGDGWLINGVPDSMYQGIPLTPEWLERFGFEKLRSASILGSSYTLDIGRNRRVSVASVEDANQMIFIQEYDPKDYRKTTDIITIWNFDYDGRISVHTLQNLIFALCGQELTPNK